MVLRAAIIPEGERIRRPAEAALEHRMQHMPVEIAQQRIALVARQS